MLQYPLLPSPKLHGFRQMYLLHSTIVSVVPLLGDGVPDEGGVVSAHGEARVHHHRVQSVPALHLEPQTPLLVSCGFKKTKK